MLAQYSVIHRIAALQSCAPVDVPPPHPSSPLHPLLQGCGHGLPGLVALRAGAEVHFQDYNRGVLTTLTMQNVEANRGAWAARRQAAARASSHGSSTSEPSPPPCRYFAGSWEALPAALAARGLAGGYDVVLTAETLYSLEAMASLYRCIRACLRPGAGVALVAAKSYYIGVGGGTAA